MSLIVWNSSIHDEMKIKWNGSKFAFAVGALQLSMAFHIFRLMSDKWKKSFAFISNYVRILVLIIFNFIQWLRHHYHHLSKNVSRLPLLLFLLIEMSHLICITRGTKSMLMIGSIRCGFDVKEAGNCHCQWWVNSKNCDSSSQEFMKINNWLHIAMPHVSLFSFCFLNGRIFQSWKAIKAPFSLSRGYVKYEQAHLNALRWH